MSSSSSSHTMLWARDQLSLGWCKHGAWMREGTTQIAPVERDFGLVCHGDVWERIIVFWS